MKEIAQQRFEPVNPACHGLCWDIDAQTTPVSD
jgi:hypothetical protein